VELVDDLGSLRPIERRVSRLAAAGVVPAEIGRRFKRSGDYIERVLVFSGFPGRRAPEQLQGLRPLERRLLRWRDQGVSPDELANRFRRGPAHIERVLALVDYKLQHSAGNPGE
jgi:DNA-binding CsgD family transcriptional regulator